MFGWMSECVSENGDWQPEKLNLPPTKNKGFSFVLALNKKEKNQRCKAFEILEGQSTQEFIFYEQNFLEMIFF